MTHRPRKVVAVLGMHRSGTSVLARSLLVLGVRLGDQLMKPDQFNERGYWEDMDVFAINEEVLCSLGRTWHDASPVPAAQLTRLRGSDVSRRAVDLIRHRTEDGHPFGMKDPRTAALLGFWQDVFVAAEAEPSFVIALRHPDLAAASLAMRNGTPPAWGHWLWIGHTLAAVTGSAGAPRVIVPTSSMVSSPEFEVRRIGRALGLEVDEEAMRRFVHEFVDRDLLHDSVRIEGAWAADCPPLAQEMFDRLQAVPEDAGLPDDLVVRWGREATAALGLLRMVELRDRSGGFQEREAAENAVLADAVASLTREVRELSHSRQLLQTALQSRHPTKPDPLPLPKPAGNALASRKTQAAPPARMGRFRRAILALRLYINSQNPGVLDPQWYLRANPDVRAGGASARIHFALHGAFEGRSPNPSFRPGHYLQQRPDVAQTGMPASLHFALWGYRETTGLNGNALKSRQPMPPEYARWIEFDAKQRKAPAPGEVPSVSVIIPVFGVRIDFLARLLESLCVQDHPDWEACIACADPRGSDIARMLESAAQRDSRIRVRFLPHNLGISGNSNEALRDAQGEFIALLDHDDELAPGALLAMASAAAQEADADLLYSDKDCIDGLDGGRLNPLFKPCWSPEMMYSVNYLTHLNLLRRSLVEDVGGFRPETDGAQDWDLFLRVSERSRKVVRVPGVLYHWRLHAASTSTGIEAKPYALAAQLRTLRDRAARIGLPAAVEECPDSGFMLNWTIPQATKVRILIDAAGAGVARAEHVRKLVTQQAQELATCEICIDTARTAEARTAVLGRATQPGAADVLLIVSAHIAQLAPGSVKQLVGWTACNRDIGFASAVVVAHDGSVVEAGHVVDRSGAGVPLFRGEPLRQWGWFGGPLWRRNCSAAGPWAIAFNAPALASAGGIAPEMDWERALTGACVALRDRGLRGVVEPVARATLVPLTMPPAAPFVGSDDPYFHPAFESVVPLRLRSAPVARDQPITASVSEAMTLVDRFTCDNNLLSTPQQQPSWVGRGPGAGWCNWHVPSLDNVYSGGAMTILRLADLLARRHGIRQRFVVDGLQDADALLASVSRAFPSLANAHVMPAPPMASIGSIPPSDLSFATLWTTAYRLLRVRNTGLKLYLVQDYEPLFYAAGSTSAQAALTYRFGFHIVANTRALGHFLTTEHCVKAMSFDPQVDMSVFYGDPNRTTNGPKRLFFYGRPGHPRNGFELGAAALAQVKLSLGEHVEIVAAGSTWDPADYGLEGLVHNLGTLSYRATADLYRSCHACLTMMMTKHPSYLPLEFMACGGLVVTNVNRHNTWLLRDRETCLVVEPSVPTIADGLVHAVEHYDSLVEVRRAGQELVRRSHGDWEGALSRIAEEILIITEKS